MNLHSSRKGGMKRISAILLAAMVLTACSEKGEVAVEEITATEAVTEEATTVATEETTVSETETTVEETTAETVVETTAETEESTTAETAVQIKGSTYAADKDSILGTWYAIDIDMCGNMTYTLNEDGSFEVFGDYEEESGTYIINNGLLECSLYDDYDEYYTQSMAAVIDGDVLILSCIGYETEQVRENYVPYEAGQSVYDYISEVDLYSEPLFMTREKPVLAEQQDILGKWIVKEYGKVVGTMLCEENSITITDGDYEETMPVILKNGVVTAVGEIPENVTLSEAVVYLCGGKLYIFEDEFPIIIERE